jgi:ParB-like chromosome segregation protein Spo0J
MGRLVESVREFGVREPGLARKRSGGGYELLCGNRRKMACEIVGLPALPVIVRELDDDNAVIAMVECILQRYNSFIYCDYKALQCKFDAYLTHYITKWSATIRNIAQRANITAPGSKVGSDKELLQNAGQ